MTAKKLALFSLFLILSSCTYTYTRVIPGEFSPRESRTQIWNDGVCYLTSDTDSIFVKTGLVHKNNYTAIFNIKIENKKQKSIHINPSKFYYVLMDSLNQELSHLRTDAENAERNIELIDNQLLTMHPPEKPSVSGVELIIGILDIFSSDTPEKEKRKNDQEQQRQREEIEYQSKMLEYQRNFNALLLKKQELEKNYLKTNDVAYLGAVSGKVEFSSPFFYRTGSYVKLILPIEGVQHNFIYNFKPNKYITITE